MFEVSQLSESSEILQYKSLIWCNALTADFFHLLKKLKNILKNLSTSGM